MVLEARTATVLDANSEHVVSGSLETICAMRVIDRAGAKVLVDSLSLTYRAGSELDYVGIFNNTEFLMLRLISMTQAVVGNFDQCHTLRRTIGVGDSG